MFEQERDPTRGHRLLFQGGVQLPGDRLHSVELVYCSLQEAKAVKHAVVFLGTGLQPTERPGEGGGGGVCV